MNRTAKKAAIALLLCISTEASAADRLVPESYASIQSAIEASATGDVISVAPGDYADALHFNGKDVKVVSRGGPSVTRINKAAIAPRGPTVVIDGGETANAVLEGFTITKGTGVFTDIFGCNCDGYELGGGIYVVNSSPVIRNCVIANNGCGTYFSRGGGVYVAGGSSRFEHCTIRDNFANGGYGSGGGIYVAGGSPTFFDCVVSGNSVSSYHSGNCGGVAVAGGSPTFERCRIHGNSASGGIGGMCVSPSTTLNRVYVSAVNGATPIAGNFNDAGGNNLIGDCNGNGTPDNQDISSGISADADRDGLPDECACRFTAANCCPGDLFPDHQVNGADLGILISQWGAIGPYTISDIDGDGIVSGSDLGLLLTSWGPCPAN
jgi:hypothetical protein